MTAPTLFLCSWCGALLALLVTTPNAVYADESKSFLARETPTAYASGKVVRKKLADLSSKERAEYTTYLAELQAGTKQQPPEPFCVDVSVFCKPNTDEGYVPSLLARAKSATSRYSNVDLTVSPASIADTKFSTLQYVGFIADGLGKSPPWSAISRIFRDNDENVIQISEWDFVADGGGLLLLDEFQNVKVGPFKGSMLKNVSATGMTSWQISWVEIRKKIELYYVCALHSKCASQATVLSLANSIYAR